MAHIWKSLVADPKRTIDEHLDLIFDDLLIQSGSRLWRSREASCLALADIIQGRKFDQVLRIFFFFFTFFCFRCKLNFVRMVCKMLPSSPLKGVSQDG